MYRRDRDEEIVIQKTGEVVEDEDINRQILGNILASEYEVTYAGNGQEAWDILQKEANDISLILLDLLMPVMDGFELIQKLQADPEADAEARFDRAKIACDRIRGDYSTPVAYYNKDLHQKSIYHERLIKDIDAAIAHEDFKVFFQPKYDISGDTPKLRSAEALIRWMHPELGMISPGEFIPLFESNGLIQKVDNYVWKKAAVQIREWKDKFGFSVAVSVNVSRVDIFDPKLLEKLRGILDENHLNEDELMLEIIQGYYFSKPVPAEEFEKFIVQEIARKGEETC